MRMPTRSILYFLAWFFSISQLYFQASGPCPSPTPETVTGTVKRIRPVQSFLALTVAIQKPGFLAAFSEPLPTDSAGAAFQFITTCLITPIM